jgi:RNA polymerase sigma-70 factor (ECF subfamily)
MGQMVEGNKNAFDELYRRYHKPLFGFFMKMLANNREKCEDFLQDLFMILIEKADYYDSSRTFKPWFYSIAHNMVKNEYKKMSVRQIMSKDEPGEYIPINGKSPEEHSQQKQFELSLDKALQKLDEEKRLAFLLKYREGFAINEIAEMQGVKEGTIKSRLFYVKKYLSSELAQFKPNA